MRTHRETNIAVKKKKRASDREKDTVGVKDHEFLGCTLLLVYGKDRIRSFMRAQEYMCT